MSFHSKQFWKVKEQLMREASNRSSANSSKICEWSLKIAERFAKNQEGKGLECYFESQWWKMGRTQVWKKSIGNEPTIC